MKSSLTKILVFTTILLSVASCRLIPKDQVPVNLKTVKITVSDSGNKEKNINPKLIWLYDNDINSAWYHDNHTSGWIKFDLSESQISIVTIMSFIPAHMSWSGAGIKNFRFEGSNDETNWDILYTHIAKNNFFEQKYFLNNTTSYRFYKLHILDSYTSNVGLSEIKLFGNIK